MRHARLALGILTAAIVFGCSPVTRLRVSFALPKSAGAIDFAKLHVRARVACESFDLSEAKPKDPEPPVAGLEEKDEDERPPLPIGDASVDASQVDAGETEATPRPRSRNAIRAVELRREGEYFHTSQRAGSCKAAATGWYDTNANGVPDRGDFVATMPSTEFHDRGLCVGNLTTVGPLELKPWTP